MMKLHVDKMGKVGPSLNCKYRYMKIAVIDTL